MVSSYPRELRWLWMEGMQPSEEDRTARGMRACGSSPNSRTAQWRQCWPPLTLCRGAPHRLSSESQLTCCIGELSGSPAAAASPRPGRYTAAAGRINRLSAGRITGAKTPVEGRCPEPIQHPLVMFSSMSKHFLITWLDKKLDGFVMCETSL